MFEKKKEKTSQKIWQKNRKNESKNERENLRKTVTERKKMRHLFSNCDKKMEVRLNKIKILIKIEWKKLNQRDNSIGNINRFSMRKHLTFTDRADNTAYIDILFRQTAFWSRVTFYHAFPYWWVLPCKPSIRIGNFNIFVLP